LYALYKYITCQYKIRACVHLEETYQLAVSDCEVSLFLAALTIADIDGYK